MTEPPTTTPPIPEPAEPEAPPEGTQPPQQQPESAMSPERMARLTTLTEILTLELSSPQKIGRWHVTDVIGYYVHYYLVSCLPYEVAVKQGAREQKTALHGGVAEPWLVDTHKLRIGYMPHIFEVRSIPVILLMSSYEYIHRGFTSMAVGEAFNYDDVKDIQKAIVGYNIRKVGAMLMDLSRDVKSAWEVANTRTTEATVVGERIAYRLLKLKAQQRRTFGGLSGVPILTQARTFITKHKTAVKWLGVIIAVILFAYIIISFLGWMQARAAIADMGSTLSVLLGVNS